MKSKHKGKRKLNKGGEAVARLIPLHKWGSPPGVNREEAIMPMAKDPEVM